MAAVDQVDLRERNNFTSLTYLTSILATGWSTAGVADSNFKLSLSFLKVFESVLYKPSEWVFIKVISL